MSTFLSEAGGALSAGRGGGLVDALIPNAVIPFDPDEWVVSLFRSLESYIRYNVDDDIYDIEFSFPSADDLGRWMPLDKTLIHFEIDNITSPIFGFGDNVVDVEYDDTDQTVIEHEAQGHRINFDVGIWASKRSGGVTARLRAFQVLNDLFVGASAYEALQSVGIELESFTGATFIKEEIDNISIFRVMGMTLQIMVYSRRIKQPIPYIGTTYLNPQLTTEDNIVIVNE